MENINAGQIKKALRVHSHIKHPTMVDCSACAYIWSESCREVLATDILALINSQEQRVKELTEENNGLQELVRVAVDTQNSMGERIEKLTEENERLKSENERYAELEEGCYVTGYKNIKADTVRKMQERLHEQFHDRVAYTRSYVHDTIDQIAKEMLEDHNNETTHSN